METFKLDAAALNDRVSCENCGKELSKFFYNHGDRCTTCTKEYNKNKHGKTERKLHNGYFD